MKHLVLGLIAYVAMGLVATPTSAQPKLSAQPEFITLFATGDTAGELTSCNCKVEDLGGLSRKGAFFHVLRDGGWEIVLLDAGGLAPFGPMDDQKALKLETLARVMAMMEYDAVSLGHRDLALGPETTAQLVEWLAQPVLATNYDLAEGLSERTRVVTERGRRVGLAAFLEEDLAAEHAPWVTVEPWEDQRDRIAALAEETDVLVVSVQASGIASVERLVELFPEIDFVVTAGEGKFGDFTFVKGTPMIGAPHQGKYLVRTDITWNEEAGAVTNLDARYLPVVKPWGFHPEIDEVLAQYNSKVRALMLEQLD